MLDLLAQTQTQEPPAFMNPVFLIVGMVLIWWLLVLKPQRKQEKARKSKLAAIKKGDNVVTRAGIVGRVSRVKDEIVFVDVGTGPKDMKFILPFQKAAIEDVLTADSASEN